MSFFSSLAYALLLTMIIEFIIYFLFIRKDPWNLLLYSILINSFTNPLMNYLYNFQIGYLYLLEGCVVVVEIVLIKLLMEISYSKALLISFFSNLTTMVIGILLFP